MTDISDFLDIKFSDEMSFDLVESLLIGKALEEQTMHPVVYLPARKPIPFDECRKLQFYMRNSDHNIEVVFCDSLGNVHGDISGKKQLLFVLSPQPQKKALSQRESKKVLAAFVDLVRNGEVIDEDVIEYVAWGVERYLTGAVNNPWPEKIGRKQANRIHIVNSYNCEQLEGVSKEQSIKNVAAWYEITEKSVRNVLNDVIPFRNK